MRFLFLILCGVMKWNWSVISRCSCSEPAAVLCVQAGFSPSAWRCCVPVCPPGVSVALCCFSSLSERTPPLSCLSARQVFTLLRDFLLTVCAFYGFFLTHSLFDLNISVHPSLCCFLSVPRISLTPSLSTHHLLPPTYPVLWRPAEAIRTDDVRWFPGSTHFYRKQPGTAAGMKLFQGVCRSRNILMQFN